MVVVAVIGGTGNVGRTLAEAFVQDGEHEVFVIARKAPEQADIVAPILAVDYNDIDAMAKILDEKKIHTIISTISMITPVAAQSERNFIAAAEKSSSVKRFIASNWGSAAPKEEAFRLPFSGYREQTLEALRQTNLEWTQVYNALFLDYFGMPHLETHLSPIGFAIDIGNRVAALPGDGNNKISLTYMKDLGKFVVASLKLEKWEEEMWCYSDFTTLNDIVKLAEKATGDKFTVTYDSVDKLFQGSVAELPFHKQLYEHIPQPFLQVLLSRFGLWASHDMMIVEKEGSLNQKFPEIETLSVEEAVSAWVGH